MKGFPNQVADLQKLAVAMDCVVRLVDAGEPARDDGVLGEEFVRAGVAGTGHTKLPIDEYIRQQVMKRPADQSFRTTARGLRELFELLGFITDVEGVVAVTDLGRSAAFYARRPLDREQIIFWRRAISNMIHDGGDNEESHPYQVLLQLVQRKPGIPRDKCPLALEAKDDSPEELDRIAKLCEFPEERIWRQLVASRTGKPLSESNWENAKKILPTFAEQLGDVIRSGKRGEATYVLADAPGRADAGRAEPARAARRREAVPRAPRTSRAVTPETIAQAGMREGLPEVEVPPNLDPVQMAKAVRIRRDRLRRHNVIVHNLAARLSASGARLYEDPFDTLAIIQDIGILIEIKTLDGTRQDEQDRVREALAQLLYYDAFVRPADANDVLIHKIACFEQRISEAHANWLNAHRIGVIWQQGDGFARDELATKLIGEYL
jgi:hypothetical protein